jgi:hypothetical protein
MIIDHADFNTWKSLCEVSRNFRTQCLQKLRLNDYITLSSFEVISKYDSFKVAEIAADQHRLHLMFANRQTCKIDPYANAPLYDRDHKLKLSKLPCWYNFNKRIWHTDPRGTHWLPIIGNKEHRKTYSMKTVMIFRDEHAKFEMQRPLPPLTCVEDIVEVDVWPTNRLPETFFESSAPQIVELLGRGVWGVNPHS